MGIASSTYFSAPIVGFEPNWRDKLITTLSWKTAIAESLTGRERRISLLHKPLIHMKYTITIVDVFHGRHIHNIIESRGEIAVGVPVWMDTCMVTHPVTTDSTYFIIRTDVRNKLFPLYPLALIYTSDSDYEVIKIDSVGTDANGEYIRLLGSEHSLRATHGVGSKIVPLAFGELKMPDSQYINPIINEIQIEFTERQGWLKIEDIYLSESASSQDVVPDNNHEFLFSPNWKEYPVQGMIDDIEYEPLGQGRTLPRVFSVAKRRTFAFTYLADRRCLQEVLQFFNNCEGMCKSFWMPTWKADARVTQQAEIGDAHVVIERTGMADMPSNYHYFYVYHDDADGKSIQTNLGGGTVVQQLCSEVFSPTTALPVPLPADTLLSLSVRVRMSSDEIEITSYSPNTHEFSLSFIECPHLSDIDLQNNNIKKIWVYKFQRQSLSSSNTNFIKWYVDYPRIITAQGITLTPADITHTGIEFNEDTLANEIEIKVAGTVAKVLLMDSDNPVDVSVYTLDREYNGTLVHVLTGRIVSLEVGDNRVCTFTLSSIFRTLDKDTPTLQVQRRCNHILFDLGCGLNRSEYTWYGNTVSFDNNLPSELGVIIKKNNSNGKTLSSYTDLIGGIIIFENYKYIICSARTLNVDEPDEDYLYLILVLDRYKASNLENHILFKFIPSCNKTIGQCLNKFENNENYGGMPWIPNNNPFRLLNGDGESEGKK